MIDIVPQNVESEMAVLGCVLIDGNCLYGLTPFLRAEHFYIVRHRWIWEAFLRLDAERRAIDTLTVTQELERKEQLSGVGGQAYITKLVTSVPSSLNAESYGRIVEELAKRRKLLEVATNIANLATDKTKTIEACLSEAAADISSLEAMNTNSDFIGMGKLLSQTYDDVCERSKNPKEVWGYYTGLPTFDKMTGGLQQGELTYLVGAPAVGKTWLDLSWGVELGKQAPGVIISLEMRRGAIGRRILSGVSGVNARRMKSGFMNDADWPLLSAALEKYENHPVFIDDSSYDTAKLRSALTSAKREHGIMWFILDYALLLTDYGQNETEQSQRISASLKRIVNDLNLAGVILHSVVKIAMENDEPKMSDQRGSGQAVHDADVQLFLTKLYERDGKVEDISPAEKAKMATLWCSKGRDLEQSRFKIHLTRRGTSPFWGEFEQARKEPEYDWQTRKDME